MQVRSKQSCTYLVPEDFSSPEERLLRLSSRTNAEGLANNRPGNGSALNKVVPLGRYLGRLVAFDWPLGSEVRGCFGGWR